MAGKVLVIGIDGGTWDIINPLLAGGRLPNLTRLVKEGVSGPLESAPPSLTPPAWTTAFTGVEPGKHGIFDFLALPPGAVRQQPVTARDRLAPAIWEILGNHGLKSVVFNAPLTFPADDIPGFVVTGMGTPGWAEGCTSPSSLATRLKTQYPGFTFGTPITNLSNARFEAYIKELYELTAIQEQAALSLAQEASPELMVFVYDDVDRLMHFLWSYMDPGHPRHAPSAPVLAEAITRYYERIDEGIGRLLAGFGAPVDVCVLSDHGFGPLHSDVFMNRALAEWGFLSPLPIAGEILKKPLYKRVARGVLSQSLRTWFRRHVKESPLGNPLGFIDWSKTRAFYPSLSGRGLMINLRGRQPMGIVEPGSEYEDVRSQANTAHPIDEGPAERRARGQGGLPARGSLPGRWAGAGARPRHRGERALRVPARVERRPLRPIAVSARSGGVRGPPEGWDPTSSGPSFRRQATLDHARIQDVAPTLLSVLQCPVGRDMDGRVLNEVLVEPKLSPPQDYSAVRTVRGERLGQEDEAAIEKRLKGLGYL